MFMVLDEECKKIFVERLFIEDFFFKICLRTYREDTENKCKIGHLYSTRHGE